MIITGNNVHYFARRTSEFQHFKLENEHEYPYDIKKKIVLIKFFRDHMNPSSNPSSNTDTDTDTDYVTKWFRKSGFMIFFLSNNMIQVNFLDTCRTKVVIMEGDQKLMFIHNNKTIKTMTFSEAENHKDPDVCVKYYTAIGIIRSVRD